MKIWKNIKWLFNNPPTTLKGLGSKETPPCDYCGSVINTRWYHEGIYCICEECRKKVFDKVLTQGE